MSLQTFLSEKIGHVVDSHRDPRRKVITASHGDTAKLEASLTSVQRRHLIDASNQNQGLYGDQELISTAGPWRNSGQISQRLARETAQDVEYVRGHGLQVVNSGFVEEQDLQLRPRPATQSFPLQAYVSYTRRCDSRVILSWDELADEFSIWSSTIRVVLIPASDISTVFYNIDELKFLFSQEKGPGLSFLTSEHLFQLREPENGYRFRRLLEQRYIGTSVNRITPENLRAFEAHQLALQPLDKVGVAVENSPSTDQDKVVLSDPGLPEVGTKREVVENYVSARSILDTGSSKLRFKYGEPVELGQLVLRMRDPGTIVNGKNKYNKLDICDGPFRIIQLPKNLLQPDILFSDTPETKHSVGYQPNKLVKLEMPAGSLAEPWTHLGRLRPVYDIPIGTNPDLHPKDIFERSIDWQATKLAGNTNTQTKECFSGNLTIARIDDEVFIKCSFVSPEGLGNNEFEVAGLRAKKLELCRKIDFPDEPQDEPSIQEYLSRGGRCKKHEIVVVKYLVHWAGWPSEDDTFERAFNNIPQQYIDDFNRSATWQQPTLK